MKSESPTIRPRITGASVSQHPALADTSATTGEEAFWPGEEERVEAAGERARGMMGQDRVDEAESGCSASLEEDREIDTESEEAEEDEDEHEGRT